MSQLEKKGTVKDLQIIGVYENILTKLSKVKLVGIICQNHFSLWKEKHTWKIKILKTKNYNIWVGVSNIYFKNGWYYNCNDGTTYSGDPHKFVKKNFNEKTTSNIKEIVLIMNMKSQSLRLNIDEEDKGEIYNNIPLDNNLTPSVLLYDENDSIEIEPVY